MLQPCTAKLRQMVNNFVSINQSDTATGAKLREAQPLTLHLKTEKVGKKRLFLVQTTAVTEKYISNECRVFGQNNVDCYRYNLLQVIAIYAQGARSH